MFMLSRGDSANCQILNAEWESNVELRGGPGSGGSVSEQQYTRQSATR